MPAKKPQAKKKVAKKATAKQSKRADVATLDDLAPNPGNPRKPWKAEQEDGFKKSLATFGDLSGVVFNKTTGQLVGGHKRVDEFRKDAAELVIADKLATPDATGTVAYGYVVLGSGTRFAYREVEWPAAKEAAANLAANKWIAEWDMEAVGVMMAEIHEDGFDLDVTGFGVEEIHDLLSGVVNAGEPSGEAGEHDGSGGMSPEQIDERIRYLTNAIGNPHYPITQGQVAVIDKTIAILCAIPATDLPSTLVKWITATDAEVVTALGGAAGAAKSCRVLYGADALMLVERATEQLAPGCRWVVICPTIASASSLLAVYKAHYKSKAKVRVMDAA